MDLILWRHAEAEERRPGLPDARRRLTPKGEKQARKMAKWLKKRLPKNIRILVSPTERTRMTAHALGLPFEIEDGVRPEAGVEELLAAADWHAGEGAVLIVGHQPVLGRAAARLLSGKAADWTLKKGALWWFMGRPDCGEADILLKVALSPELI